MHPAVEAIFLAFTRSFESYIRWLYLDAFGYVTIGYGNIVDPPRLMGGLDFIRPDGSKATDSEVQAYWLTVKNRQDLKGRGGAQPCFQELGGLRATPESIERFASAKLRACDDGLAKLFPCWATWPADAQLACLSMVWALGLGKFTREFPKFQDACRVRDWARAAAESHMSEVGQPREFHLRNEANRKLLSGAGASDPEAVSWPL